MVNIVCSLFTDTKAAGDAVADLKGKGYAESISVVHKDEFSGKTKTTNVDQNIADGTAAGAVVGGAVGTVAGLLVGAASFVVPGAGLIVLGPLATVLSGATAGAVTGGIVGALVDKGIPEDQAKKFQDAVQRGEVLVCVAVSPENESIITSVLKAYGGVTAVVDKT